MEGTKLTTTVPGDLIAMAIEKGAGVEQLEKLMDLQERWNAQQAKKSYLSAISEFQSKCPVLKKSKTVAYKTKAGSTNYKYAPLGDIQTQIKNILKDCGLSFRWEFAENDKISVTCIVSHIDGHSEKTTMAGEKDSSGSKNSIQQIGSTLTYLQRYTLIGALGISTADEDKDGGPPKKDITEISKSQSENMLKQSKGVIDQYTEAKPLKNKGRLYLNSQSKSGMHKSDLLNLQKYINTKYVVLLKENQESNIELP